MQQRKPSRCFEIWTAVGALGLLAAFGTLEPCQGWRDRADGVRLAHAPEPKVSAAASAERFDFEQTGIEGWKNVDGRNG